MFCSWFLLRIYKTIAPCIWISVILLILVACAAPPQYTTKDLAILPCENEENEFFLPLEFSEEGKIIYADQLTAIESALQKVKQVYIFAHGWDQTTRTAEADYQDLMCRFRTHSVHSDHSSRDSIVVGLFWPSAGFPPWLNFWTMKNRVDTLAETGFSEFLDAIAYQSFQTEQHYKLAFIGHSFGARLIVTGLREYFTKLNRTTYKFLSNLDQLQLVLLNAAIGEYALMPQSMRQMEIEFDQFSRRWHPDLFHSQMKNRYREEYLENKMLVDMDDIKVYWMPSLTELASVTDLRIYNVMSKHDMADLYLYRLGSITEERKFVCAIGACGLKQWDNIAKIDMSGSIDAEPDLTRSNVWNVDASDVITAHSDIYKGRVAKFIFHLLDLPRPRAWEDSEASDNSVYQNRRVSTETMTYKDVYDLSRQINLQAMSQINRLRSMSQEQQEKARTFVALAFDVDHYINNKHWRLAEQSIRELLEFETCYPGWWLQQNVGVLRPDNFLFFDSHALVGTRMRLCGDTLKFLLAYTLTMQQRCREAVDVLKQMQSYNESRFEKSALSNYFPIEKALFCSCVQGSVVVHVGATWEELQQYVNSRSRHQQLYPSISQDFPFRINWPSWLFTENN